VAQGHLCYGFIGFEQVDERAELRSEVVRLRSLHPLAPQPRQLDEPVVAALGGRAEVLVIAHRHLLGLTDDAAHVVGEVGVAELEGLPVAERVEARGTPSRRTRRSCSRR